MEQIDTKLSVLIPAYNEEEVIESTILEIHNTLSKSKINHEILVVNDNSTDNTLSVLNNQIQFIKTLRVITSEYNNGFGNAVKYGLENWHGDVIVIVMADASDSPNDIVMFFNYLIKENVDCVFGNRFISGGGTYKYPIFKLFLNRLFNNILRLFIDFNYNDYTNAFKMYRKDVIKSILPIKSEDFSLTIEIPLKVIKKGFKYSILPNKWNQRKFGESKLNIFKNSKSYFLVLFNFLTNRL